jgi:hypothetical protein
MNDKELNTLKKHMVTLLTIFKDKPNILVKYILEYDILPDNIKHNIIENKELKNRSEELELDDDDNLETPYFSNIKEMINYYHNFFKSDNIYSESDSYDEFSKITFPYQEEPKRDSLLKDLESAIENEDYEKCAKIRDYCIKKNIDL